LLFWKLGWGVSQIICPRWPSTVILLISASQAARITGVSHQIPAFFFIHNICSSDGTYSTLDDKIDCDLSLANQNS
jgi:hypothetical protein